MNTLHLGEAILARHVNMTGRTDHAVPRLNISVLGLDFNAKQH